MNRQALEAVGATGRPTPIEDSRASHIRVTEGGRTLMKKRRGFVHIIAAIVIVVIIIVILLLVL